MLNRLVCLLQGHLKGDVVKGLDEVFSFNYMTAEGVVKVTCRKCKRCGVIFIDKEETK